MVAFTLFSDAVEKAVLLAGSFKDVTEVKIDNMEAPEPAADVESYAIISGDSLSRIAKNHYGNTMADTKLSEANPEVIKDPCLIYGGQKIRIPPKTWQMITTNNQVVVRGMNQSMQYYSDPIHTLTIDILLSQVV